MYRYWARPNKQGSMFRKHGEGLIWGLSYRSCLETQADVSNKQSTFKRDSRKLPHQEEPRFHYSPK